jgi:uncharacterized membrane protein YccC
MNAVPNARFWHVVGGGLVLIVVVASLVPAGSLPHLGMTDKLEHMIAYGGLALCYGGLMAPRRYGYLGLALLVLGGGIEIAQGLMGWGREADWRDFYADAFGTAVGLALCMAGLRHWTSWADRWLIRH